MRIIFLNLFGQHFSIQIRMFRQESLSETGREGRLRLFNAFLSAGNLGGVSANEVIHGLVKGEFRDWWKHTIGVASEEDNVLWVSTSSWYLDIINVFQRIAAPGIFSQRDIIII